jgi:hypothetical protein
MATVQNSAGYITALTKKLKNSSVDENHKIRIHRAISWLKSAEKSTIPDIQFVSYWIAFNSCYANEIKNLQAKSEKEMLKQFLEHLIIHDSDRIYNLLWEKFTSSIRILLENKYVFEPFWAEQRGEINHYESLFKKSQEDASKYLSKKNVSGLLYLILERLYCLRNQLIHGGATFESKINRATLKDACRVLQALIPILIDIMIEHEDDWGKIAYPVVD